MAAQIALRRQQDRQTSASFVDAEHKWEKQIRKRNASDVLDGKFILLYKRN